MMERQHSEFLIECDACGDVLETATGDFHEARAVMQREGWKAKGEGKPPNMVWIHGCNTCGLPQTGLFARNERMAR